MLTWYGGGGATTMRGWQMTDDLGVSISLFCQIHHCITLTNVRNTFSLLLFLLTSAISRIQLSDCCRPSPWVPYPCWTPAAKLGVMKIGINFITVGTGAAASLATFKKAFRARATLVCGKQSGKVPQEAGASSAYVYTMQAISLPFDSSRNLFLHVIWSYTGFKSTRFSSYTLDSQAIGYFGCDRLTPPVQPLLLRCW